jgi:hypothetical protein
LKKYYFLFLTVFITISISGCNLLEVEESLTGIEMIAFNSLTNAEQDKIPVSPMDSVVQKITVNDDLGSRIGDEFVGKKLYSVTFNHTETESLGNLIVYVGLDKKTVVGNGYEDINQ